MELKELVEKINSIVEFELEDVDPELYDQIDDEIRTEILEDFARGFENWICKIGIEFKSRLLSFVDETVFESELGRYFANEETFLDTETLDEIIGKTFSFDDNFDYDGNLDREAEVLIDEII